MAAAKMGIGGQIISVPYCKCQKKYTCQDYGICILLLIDTDLCCYKENIIENYTGTVYKSAPAGELRSYASLPKGYNNKSLFLSLRPC
jgi:hypothetical protein